MDVVPPKGSYRFSIYKDYALMFSDIVSRLAEMEVRAPKAKIRRKLLKDFDAEMFPAGYQRFCNTHEPTILETQAECDAALAAGKDVMVFPLYGEGSRRCFVSDDSDPDYRYVGLKRNKSLTNQSKYPYLPCTYPKPQNTPGKARYEYENEGEHLEESGRDRRGYRPHIYLNNQAMKSGAIAILPVLVNKYLCTLDHRAFPITQDQTTKAKPTFAREGSIRDKNSVLDAMFKAATEYYSDLDTDNDKRVYKESVRTRSPLLAQTIESYKAMDSDQKAVFLSKFRKSLTDIVASNITGQSTYNVELKTIYDELKADISYLDVKLVWRILEEVFHVNIILFQRNADHQQGVLGSPLFLQEYLQYQHKKSQTTDRFTIMLFETIGGGVDRLQFPQVELIKWFDYDEGIQTFSYFTKKKDVTLINRLQTCFNQIFSYDGHPNQPIPNVFLSKPIGQCTDFYGKVRLLQFANDLCIMTEPLPPIDASEMVTRPETKCNLVPVKLSEAQTFLKLEGVTNVKKVVIGTMLVGLQCFKATDNKVAKPFVSFYIPIEPTEDRLSLETAPVIAPSFIGGGKAEIGEQEDSMMDEFNRLSRLSRYIIEYVLWVFSKWHQLNKGPNPSDPVYLEQFASESFQIVDGHEYPKRIPRRLDPNLAGVLNRGRILVPLTDVRNRLLFALQIRLMQSQKEVLSYYNRIYIRQYYQDVTDFDLQDTSVILFGVKMVISWINSKLPSFILYDRIQFPCLEEEEDIEESEENIVDTQICKLIEEKGLVIDPYFIQLEDLDWNIYIVQQASDLGNALWICDMWNRRGYNVGSSNSGKLLTSIPFRFITYNNAYDYTVTIINESADIDPEPYTVIQYKVNDEIQTAAMLRYSQFD